MRALVLALALVACRREAPPARPDASRPTPDVARDVTPEADALAVPDDVPTPARRVVVTLTGDLMLHRAVLDTFARHEQQGGVAWALNWLSPLITTREVALTWLDSPLTDTYRTPFTGVPPALGTPRAMARTVARDLGRVGLDGVCLATHHAWDQMGDGLGETLETLRAQGLGVVGAGATDDAAWSPWITERDGVRVAFLCFTQHVVMAAGRNSSHSVVAQTVDVERAVAAVQAARPNADIVVAGIQWNRQPFRPLSDEQRALARRLVDAGADVVAGTGVVTPGAVERVPSPRGDAVIAWSMGSLLSNYGTLWRGERNPAPPGTDRLLSDAATRDVVLLRAQFEVGAADADANTGTRLSLVTLTANALWMQHAPEGLRVTPLRALLDLDVREGRARAITAALGPDVRVRQ